MAATHNTEHQKLFLAPMEEGVANATKAIVNDCCNRYQCAETLGPIEKAAAGDEAAIAALAKLQESGKMNYLLKCEAELADYFDMKYGIAVASGGLAIMLGLKAMHRVYIGADVKPEDVTVYSNSFTFNAVPSAIVNAGFKPTFVQTTPMLTIDWDDLERQIKEDTAAGKKHKVLVLSYMRGRIPDMDAILRICKEHNVWLLEDNAHGYGAEWKGRKIGNFGLVSAISTQANKLINTGEGGFIFTNEDRIQAYFMFSTGCYEELWKKHERMCPSKEAIDEMRFNTANFSCRMPNISACIAHPQIAALPARIAAHNANYYKLKELCAEKLNSGKYLDLDSVPENLSVDSLIEFIPQLEPDVFPVYDSLQLRFYQHLPNQYVHKLVKAMTGLGFKMQVFADATNARYYRSWHYCLDDVERRYVKTDEVLHNVVDMRLLAHDTPKDVEHQAESICTEFAKVWKDARSSGEMDIAETSTVASSASSGYNSCSPSPDSTPSASPVVRHN